MRSSYLENDYGKVIEDIVKAEKPTNCVELGVLDGYSTIAIARGLAANDKGMLTSVDLFEDYAFKHGTPEEVGKELVKAGLDRYVRLVHADAFEHAQYRFPYSVDLLHVDISNTGEILRRVMEVWHPKMKVGGVILFEGGSEERDRVEWVAKYGKTPIRPELLSNETIRENYEYKVLEPFPSMTVFRRLR